MLLILYRNELDQPKENKKVRLVSHLIQVFMSAYLISVKRQLDIDAIKAARTEATTVANEYEFQNIAHIIQTQQFLFSFTAAWLA